MTTTAAAPAERAATVPVERVPGSRLARHAVALTLVLLALMPLLGRGRLFSPDEGAVAAQAELLARGDGWWLDHPLAELDPDGGAFPLHLSHVEDGRGAPFAKHPLYPVLLAPFARVGGVPAMVLVSLAGTLASALVAAALARRLRPGLDGPVLWLVGLASPLFFYGYVLIAHTLGAALAGLAALLALGERRAALRAAAVAGVVLLAALLRSEAVLFGLALAAGSVLVGVVRRDRSLLGTGVGAGLGAVAGRLIGPLLSGLVVEAGEAVTPVAVGGSGFVSGRLAGAFTTWLLPSYNGLGLDDLLLALTVVFSVLAVLVARRRPEDGAGVRLFAVLAVAALVGRLLLPVGATPGLLVAFPVLAAGLAAVDRTLLADRTAAVLTAAYLCFAGGVLATQYPTGGSGEWGGRYFALGLTLIVPVVVAGLARVRDGLDPATARFVTGAVGALAVLGAVAAAAALVHHQTIAARTVDLVQDARTEAGPGVVVIATDGTTGRRAWADVLDGQDWLLVEDEERLGEVGRVLADEGRPLVVSTYEADRYLDELAPWYEVVAVERPTPDEPRAVHTLLPR